jgi:hypothetical protein
LSDDFIVKPIRFKILINDSPKRTIVPRKLSKATDPCSIFKPNIKIIEVTNNVGIKNMNISAKTIPE